MRIVFTGGSGKAGQHAIDYLVKQGHDILNLDLVPLDRPDVYTLKTDLTDSGQVFNALSTHFKMSEYFSPDPPPRPDAVIHFATVSRPYPTNEMFSINVKSMYNIVEAACKLGIKKVILGSSETVYGVCFTQGDSDYHSFPIEEDYDCDPADTYAISKLCGERIARGFARRFGIDIYIFRIGNIIRPDEYEQFKTFLADPPSRKRNAWSYTDARDLGKLCDCAVRTDGLGFQVFNATNDTITLNEKTVDFLKKTCPSVPITREMDDYEAPISNRKAKRLLGFEEEHNWRKYV